MTRRARRRHSVVRVIARRTMYQGRVIRLVREVLQVRDRRLVRETILHPGAVVIIPRVDRSHLVFIRQYRRAVGRTLLELPAGTLDPPESPRVCAQRELEEETGFRAKRLRRVGAFYPAPGLLSEQMTLFLADGLTPGPAHPEADEMIRPVVLSLREAMAKIRSGAICDAKTILGVWFVRGLSRR